MSKRAVIPNEVRDLASGDGSCDEGRVSKASGERSFASLRMTGVLL